MVQGPGGGVGVGLDIEHHVILQHTNWREIVVGHLLEHDNGKMDSISSHRPFLLHIFTYSGVGAGMNDYHVDCILVDG